MVLREFGNQFLLHAKDGIAIQIGITRDKDMGDKSFMAGCCNHEMHMGRAHWVPASGAQ